MSTALSPHRSYVCMLVCLAPVWFDTWAKMAEKKKDKSTALRKRPKWLKIILKKNHPPKTAKMAESITSTALRKRPKWLKNNTNTGLRKWPKMPKTYHYCGCNEVHALFSVLWLCDQLFLCLCAPLTS